MIEFWLAHVFVLCLGFLCGATVTAALMGWYLRVLRHEHARTILLLSKLTPKARGEVLRGMVASAPAEARNNAAVAAPVNNASVDHQKIRTAEIELPVIAADVLTYEPGELGPAYQERTRLYYTPEALKDPEYLQTVLRSPLQIQTHEKNTTEHNRGVDGWPTLAWWDDTEKRVKVKGVLHGESNVQYAESNRNKPDFGTSAFISFLEIERTPGTAPNGKPYDAMVKKAVNNHIAILPGVRDPGNVILAMNAVAPAEPNDAKNQDQEKPKEEKRMALDKDEFRAAMQAYQSEENREDELVNKIKNAVMEEMKGGDKTENKAKNEDGEDSEKKEKPVEEKKEDADAANSAASFVQPSEAMIKAFSDSLGVAFNRPPSIRELASLVGVEGKTDADLVTALNAKKAAIATTETATEKPAATTVDQLLKGL